MQYPTSRLLIVANRLPVWEAYVYANRLFCNTIVREARGDELIWVHDYHLLLPAMLREHFPTARIGFFLHTPFPPSELFHILPCREALLRVLLGADLRHLQFPEICALLRRADVALVTPLRDGMNLLLERMQALHTRICTHTVPAWAQNFLTGLENLPPQQTVQVVTPTVRQQLLTAYAQATRRVLLLDYDGTLTPLVELRHRAVPSPQLLTTLQTLQRDPRNVVVVISGRDCPTPEHWLGPCGCRLVAEHGAWRRDAPTGPWCRTHAELQLLETA